MPIPPLTDLKELNGMGVAQLRKELGKHKLDVDGSKEALVSRLEEAKRQKMD